MALLSSQALLKEQDLRKRLEKLSRHYDLPTMKTFIACECLGENLVYSTYNGERRSKWDFFLNRSQACRLDLNRHERTREKYKQFLYSTPREEQGRQFHAAVLALMRKKGAVDMFRQLKACDDVEETFSGHLCKLFDRKIESWFDSFEALAVNLIAHVKVSNYTRVLNGQIDALCKRDGHLHVVNVKVTGQETPRPLDIAELGMCKAMVIQNGLAGPEDVRMSLLVCHLSDRGPILRLWTYKPSDEMEQAIREGDIDKMIDGGKLTQYHEFWRANVHLIGEIRNDRLFQYQQY